MLAPGAFCGYNSILMKVRDQDLFAHGAEQQAAKNAPLADRMRPRSLAEFVGQSHLLGPGRLLREIIERGSPHSLVLWGPPGVGKTTLAYLLAEAAGAHLVAFSAVLSGVKELRLIVEEAAKRRAYHGRGTVLFIDEIHRWNKAQQDALLPRVEKGALVLLGATTENPSFEIIGPLLSRVQVVVLEPLAKDGILVLLRRALQDPERGLGQRNLVCKEDALDFMANQGRGDGRAALNILEVAASLAEKKGTATIDLALAEEAAQHRALLYDKAGEEHYNVISAFIKSMRGSDPDAALYWLMRMLEAGEDPLFIARRMVIFAAEDVGNADPQALQVAVAAKDAVHFVGLPEGRIPLAQAVTYLATAPKSNASYMAMLAALREVKDGGPLAVPLDLRNAPTRLMRDLGYGAAYQYPHDYEDALTDQAYLPGELEGHRYYFPTDRGYERMIRERMTAWRKKKGEKPGGGAPRRG